MKLHTAHFTFETVNNSNLQVLLQFRNSPVLRNYMVHKDEITLEQQQKWFAGLDHELNFYFLVKWQGNYVGYTLLKNINFEKKTGEPGTFLIHEELHESSLAALFMLSFLDICYYFFEIEYFFGNVLSTNNRALANYRIFQPDYVSASPNGELLLQSTADFNYPKATEKIRKALSVLYHYSFLLTIDNDIATDPPGLLKRSDNFTTRHIYPPA